MPESFSAFWPHYLREHSQPGTRALHHAGTSLDFMLAAAFGIRGRWWLLAAVPVAGYGFAWASHFLVEHNRPATFAHPFWSIAADFRMWWLWLTGGLTRELAAAGVHQDRETKGGG